MDHAQPAAEAPRGPCRCPSYHAIVHGEVYPPTPTSRRDARDEWLEHVTGGAPEPAAVGWVADALELANAIERAPVLVADRTDHEAFEVAEQLRRHRARWVQRWDRYAEDTQAKLSGRGGRQ